MRWSSRWLLVVPVAALGLASGCCRPSGGAPPGVSAKEAVLADMKDLKAEPPEAVVGHVNESGTGGALVVQVASGARVAFRDQLGPEYEAVEGVAVSPDGQRLAYAARVEGRMRMVLDGKLGAAQDLVGEPIFTRDSRHLFYRCETAGRSQLVIDERPGPPVFAIELAPFLLAGREEVVVVERPVDGPKVEVAAYGLGMQRRVLATLEGAEAFFPSPDGGRLAVVVESAGARRVVALTLGEKLQREEGPQFDVITAVAFDPTSTHLMQVGAVGGQAFAILDGVREQVASFEVVAPPVFDPVRKALTFAYQGPDGAHVATAFAGQATPSPAYTSVNELVRSPDGRHLAFIAEQQGTFFLVVDGVESADRYDRLVSPRFSPDGRFLAVRARRGGQRFMLVADATGKTTRAHQPFEQVFPPEFTPDGKSIAYAVKDGSRLRWRVEPL